MSNQEQTLVSPDPDYKQKLIDFAEQQRSNGAWQSKPVLECDCGKTDDPRHPKRGKCRYMLGGVKL